MRKLAGLMLLVSLWCGVSVARSLGTLRTLDVSWQGALRKPDLVKGYQFPRWERGRFLFLGSATSGHLLMFDRKGELVSDLVPDIPGWRVTFRAATLATDGGIAIAGNALSSQTASTSYIAWLTPLGGIRRIIQARGFTIEDIVFANDGTLWAAGSEYDLTTMRGIPNKNVLRHYSQEGVLMYSILNWDSFRPYRKDDLDSSPGFRGRLAVSSSGAGVGLYSVSRGEWVELTSAGVEVGRWSGLSTPTLQEVTGVAYVNAENVFISAKVWGGPKGSSAQPTYGIYKLDKKQNRWDRVNTEKLGLLKRYVTILGLSGNDVVVWSGVEDIWALKVL